MFNPFSRQVYTLALLLPACLLAAISWPSGLRAQGGDQDIPVPVSINALMVTLIDHSAHYIWDYAAMSRAITDEEWRTVEYYAIQLSGSGPLITLGGSGVMDDTWAEDPRWVAFSRDMSNAAMKALEAAGDKDKDGLGEAGDALIVSCLGCHDTFKPDVPTEGIMHQPDYDYLYHLFERQ
jgi:hypothetical protein